MLHFMIKTPLENSAEKLFLTGGVGLHVVIGASQTLMCIM